MVGPSLAVAVVLLAGAAGRAAQEEPAPPAVPETTPALDDPTRTACGALVLFMSSRDYGAIRKLKSVMTPALAARFDKFSAPFNGKRGIRLAAFDIDAKDAKALGTKGPESKATVTTLWEEQGEAVELRTESVRLTQQPDGLWRASALEKVTSESLRFPDPIAGVTTLRMVLRAWHRRNLAAARALMSPAFLKAHEATPDEAAELQAIFTGAAAPSSGDGAGAPTAPPTRRAAFEILSLQPQGDVAAKAMVRLYETTSGQPGPIDGPVVTVGLVKKGPRWLLDSWR